MAEETQDDIDVSEGSGRKKWLLIGSIVLILLIGGGAGFLMLSGNPEAEKTAETATDAEATQQAAPIYHAFQQPLVVNFSKQSNDEVRYLQIQVEVMSRSEAAIKALQRHQPAIVHELLMLFYSQNYDDLSTREGTRALKSAAADTINDFLSREEKLENGIDRVLFSSFVMQ